MKDYNKDEEGPFLQYEDANNLYGWVIIQPLPADGFKFVKDVLKIDEDFIKDR